MTHSTRLLIALMVLTLQGCSAGDADFSYPDPRDCRVDTPLGCMYTREDVCALGIQLRPYCIDQDNDCFYESCSADAPKWVTERLLDCNGLNPDVNPFSTDICDGVDNNCNGIIDDQYAIGDPCEQCGTGRLECAIDDPTRTVCSTLPGQSDGPELDEAEPCDLLDNDCDGRVDESCRLTLTPDDAIDDLEVCADHLYIIQGPGIMKVSLSDPMSAAMPELFHEGAERIREFRCGTGGFAWLESDVCVEDVNEPSRCTGVMWVRETGGEPRAATGLGSYGGLLIDDDSVYFHSLVEEISYINRLSLAGGAAEVIIEGASDATKPDPNGRMAVRSWEEEARARVKLYSISDPGVETLISNPITGANRPMANTRWVAWVTGDDLNQVWVVPVDDLLHGGFLAVRLGSPLAAVQLMEDSLFFMDTGTDTLERFHLDTGRREVLARGPFPNEQFSAQGASLVWVYGGESDPLIRVRQLNEPMNQ